MDGFENRVFLSGKRISTRNVTVLITFINFMTDQAARSGASGCSSRVLKGGVLYRGGRESTSGRVGVLLASLCRGAFCSGIVGHILPVSPRKRVIS